MDIPADLRYTDEHEWVRAGEGGIARLGITDYAQDALDDVVYVSLPEVGTAFQADAAMAELESHKSVAEVYAPLAGTVVAVNGALEDDPGLVNRDPYGEGWLLDLRLKDPTAAATLLDADAYRAIIT
ncbi:MAG: glycine cleavage system protein GcvH [Acidimicrobiia bacterium]